MLRILFLRYFLAVSVLAIVCIFLPGNGFGKNIRRYPCDPKFGYTGNYLELTTGSVAHAKGVKICFSRAASEKMFEKIVINTNAQ